MLFTSAACRSKPTQVELFIDSDAPANRSIALRIRSYAGALDPQAIAARAQELGSVGEISLSRDAQSQGNFVLGGSVGILPISEGSGNTVTVWLRMNVGATATTPEILLDRVARLSFVRNLRGTARIYLPLRCGDTAVGCTSVSAAECTVSVRCREQNATCGDLGECVVPEVPTVFPQADASDFDVPAAPLADAATGRAEVNDVGPPMDAQPPMDVPEPVDVLPGREVMDESDMPAVADVPSEEVDPSLIPPRQLAPGSTHIAATLTPLFEWQWPNGLGVDQTQIQLCTERACNVPIVSQVVDGLSWRPPVNLLANRVIYWRVRSVRMGVKGAQWSPMWEFRTPAQQRPAGTFTGLFADYNGDGLSDIAVAMNVPSVVFVYYGRMGGPSSTPDLTLRDPMNVTGFGNSIAPAGDINGDGYGDLLVGNPNVDNLAMVAAGNASLFLGSPMGLNPVPAIVVRGSMMLGHFGAAVSGAGDIDHDGYGDFIIGAPDEVPAVMMPSGIATVYYGEPIAPLMRTARLPSFIAGAAGQFARSVAGPGDVNGDGFADVVVGCDYRNNVGVYYGGRRAVSPIPDVRLRTLVDTNRFGFSVAGVGDINADGFADVGVSAIGEDSGGLVDSGSVKIFPGSAVGLSSTELLQVDGVGAGDQFGISLSSAGDINRDGRDEFMVGAYFADPNALSNAGTATIFSRSAAGVISIARTLAGTVAEGSMGVSVALSPDCNGDGAIDLLVGSHREPSLAGRGGAVRLYYTSALLGISAVESLRLASPIDGSAYGFSIAQLQSPVQCGSNRTLNGGVRVAADRRIVSTLWL